MNKIITLIITLALFNVAFSQKGEYIKRPAIGIHFLFDDFETSYNIRTTSLRQTLKDNKWAKLDRMIPGFALSYMQGITNHLDFSTSISGSFLSYPINDNTSGGTDKLLLEVDAMIYAKMLSDKHLISPYLSAGIGGSRYSVYYGAFVPLGAGIQVNLFDEAFLLVNSQYRVKLSDNVNYHFYHSIGIAGNIGKERAPKAIPPPPIPTVVPPLDSDSDGVIDSLDACPDIAGIIQTLGCPDADNDGIADKEDKCPAVPGLARYQGCPIPDADQDGVNDEEDKCPSLAGVARLQGCPVPDTDSDGINDEEDKCPGVPGVRENNGCPVISEAIVKKMALASRNIFFASGSAKLLAKSNAALNGVARLLADSTDLKLDIEGHTDNTGSAAINETLSQKRADAVKDYLVKKGADISRITSAGYGPGKPVADNKTAAGRAKNRRVELKLKYY